MLLYAKASKGPTSSLKLLVTVLASQGSVPGSDQLVPYGLWGGMVGWCGSVVW